MDDPERWRNDNPVTVTNNDTVGAALLGLLAFTLLIALLRSQAQCHALLDELAQLRRSSRRTWW